MSPEVEGKDVPPVKSPSPQPLTQTGASELIAPVISVEEASLSQGVHGSYSECLSPGTRNGPECLSIGNRIGPERLALGNHSSPEYLSQGNRSSPECLSLGNHKGPESPFQGNHCNLGNLPQGNRSNPESLSRGTHNTSESLSQGDHNHVNHQQQRLSRSQSLPAYSERWLGYHHSRNRRSGGCGGGGKVKFPEDKKKDTVVLKDQGNGVAKHVLSDRAPGRPAAVGAAAAAAALVTAASSSGLIPDIGSSRQRPRDPHATLRQHYYPEGGWGWVIIGMATGMHLLCHGLQTSFGALLGIICFRFQYGAILTGWLGALSTSLALLVSPVTIAVCRRNSTRLTAVIGGLVTALGCLFTSFASQFHQLFFSYGTVIGIGVGMTRDSSTLMVGQYFKRRREIVEIIVVSGSGLGITVMSVFIRGAIGSVGWRLGLQAVTGVIFLTFLMGTFYRSASLYHPQRRAILHLKNQKRKVKEKNRQDDKPPFFDLTTLRSRTVQILLVSIGLSSFGITTPIIYLAHQAEEEGLEDSSVLLLQTYLGVGWVIGCCAFGFVVVQKNTECRVGRQYLCQASMFLCGVATLAFTAVEGYHGYVMFAWLYGIFCGGFHYSLKMYTYEKVRARNFARTWGFVQCSQAIPTAIGVPITGYINIGYGDKAGYYFSSTFVIFGSMTIFLIDIHRRNVAKQKNSHKNHDTSESHTCGKPSCPETRRRDSLAHLTLDNPKGHAPSLAVLQQRSYTFDPQEPRSKPELTCISEEGIADMDLPDHLFELEYLGDCITSCDKVENYLMMSEYENNLKHNDISSVPYILDRRGKRRLLSLTRQSSSSANCKDSSSPRKLEKAAAAASSAGGGGVASAGAGCGVVSGVATSTQEPQQQQPPPPPIAGAQRPNLKSGNFRSITVIEEASV